LIGQYIELNFTKLLFEPVFVIPAITFSILAIMLNAVFIIFRLFRSNSAIE